MIEFETKPYLQHGRPCIAPLNDSNAYDELKKLITVPCRITVEPIRPLHDKDSVQEALKA